MLRSTQLLTQSPASQKLWNCINGVHCLSPSRSFLAQLPCKRFCVTGMRVIWELWTEKEKSQRKRKQHGTYQDNCIICIIFTDGGWHEDLKELQLSQLRATSSLEQLQRWRNNDPLGPPGPVFDHPCSGEHFTNR